MVRGLLILDSATAWSRDLWWPLLPEARRGYNVYRAMDAPYNWVKLNKTGPVPGQFFRDRTELIEVRHAVADNEWIDRGVTGQVAFRLPEIPYSRIQNGKPLVASAPEDVAVEVIFADGFKKLVRPALVSGIDQTVFLPTGVSVPANGDVSSYPVINFKDAAAYTAIYAVVSNYVDIQATQLRTYYTVVPVGPQGEMHLPGAPGTEVVSSLTVDRMDYMQANMVLRNRWIFEQVGEPAFLMFRRRAGALCGCAQTETGSPRTHCPICFETGIVGGYYGPYDFLFIDPDVAATRTLDEGGIKVERSSRSYLGPTPVVQDGDLVVRRNGERLVISGVTYKMPRGVMLQQDFDVELLPPGDTRYLIPLANPAQPVIYNPLYADPLDGQGGAEPIYQTGTVDNKRWENPDHQVGRTVTFGRIQA